MAVENAINTIHISSKSHLNLTFNLNQCGDGDISPGGTLNMTMDNSFMLVCVTEGAALLEADDLGFPIKGPQGFFIFPDMCCKLFSSDRTPMHVTWLRFSGYLVEHYLSRANISRSRPVFQDEQREVLSRMEAMHRYAQTMPNRYCHMMSILYDIFALLLDRDRARAKIHYIDDANIYALKAAEYIERHYTLNPSVDEIARAVGISRKHLYAVFNEIMRIPPKQYLIYYRIEKASWRLRTSTQSIQEIAEAVGYANQFYFAKEFKRLTGVTPSEYRRNPEAGDIFSYRTFLPALQERLQDHSMELPPPEFILTPPPPPGHP